MKYDTIFDFSASPVGGGIKRLTEYIRYFARSHAKVLFLAHPTTERILPDRGSVTVEFLPRPVLRRLFDDASLVARFQNRARCYFSYGIPVSRRMSDLDWFHISNALPLVYRRCTLSATARAKNWLLEQRFRAAAGRVDILSAESRFSLDAYHRSCGVPPEGIVLRNGVDAVFAGASVGSPKKGFALTVGVQSYKRLGMAYEVYHSIRARAGLTSFVIVGDRDAVPARVKHQRDVTITGWVSDEDLSCLSATARVYISASEVENSSNAVLEAFCSGATCVLSKIPSHQEMVSRDLPLFPDLRSDFFVADAGCLQPEQCQSWTQTIDTMCDRMGLPRSQV